MQNVSNGLKKWQTSHWQRLLRDTISIIESVSLPVQWTFGGGTALAVHLSHRISYDIDAFVTSTDIIRDLTPNRNPTTKRILGEGKYEYPGNYLKLCFDHGEIDIIVASSRTEKPTEKWQFEAMVINIETPSEIIVKKIFYRPSSFKVRDVFDFAATLPEYGDILYQNIFEVDDKLDKVIDRIKRMSSVYETLALSEVNPTEIGQQFMSRNAIDSVIAFLESWKSQ